jgi:translation initiation factor 3 subunit B
MGTRPGLFSMTITPRDYLNRDFSPSSSIVTVLHHHLPYYTSYQSKCHRTVTTGTTMRPTSSSSWTKVTPRLSASKSRSYSRTDDRFAVDAQQGVENVVVVDNVPIVDEGKREKLVARLRALFEKAGAAIDEDRIDMPWDDAAGTNKG